MPKPPPIEVIRVTCHTSKENLGHVVAALIKAGVADISHDLVTMIPAFKQNGPRPEIPSSEFLSKWIEEHPTFRAIEVARAFEADGRNPTHAYPAIGQLVEKGVLKKLDKGNYARADVKHIAPPKKKRTEKKAPHRSDKTGVEVILAYAKRNHGRFNTPKLIELFTKEGRGAASVYATIHKMVEGKLAKRVGGRGSGTYVLLQKAAASKQPETAPKANGNGSPAIEEAHGH